MGDSSYRYRLSLMNWYHCSIWDCLAEVSLRKADFLATGEVLGQRPFSQNKSALQKLEKEAGLKGKILRPLSAKLLDETIVERQGKVPRDKLFAWKGRSRKPQIAEAKKRGIKIFASPAGGCLLTDISYCRRLKEMMNHWPNFDVADAALLSIGRHFWQKDTLYVVGRDKEENVKLGKSGKKNDILIHAKNFPGPTILVRSKGKRGVSSREEFLAIIREAKLLISRYAHKTKPSFEINFRINGKTSSNYQFWELIVGEAHPLS